LYLFLWLTSISKCKLNVLTSMFPCIAWGVALEVGVCIDQHIVVLPNIEYVDYFYLGLMISTSNGGLFEA